MKKILIIDDEPMICSALKMLLEDARYDVITAENGRQGIELYKTENPDLVISDINMPEMNGFQVCEYIHNDNPDLPVIVLSGLGAVEDAMKAIKLGAWDFVTKPIKDFSVFEHSINKIFEKAQLLKDNKKYKEFLEQTVEKQSTELIIEKDFRKISEAKFKNLFENVNDVVFILLNDVIVDSNKKADEFFKKYNKGILGTFFWEYFPEKQLDDTPTQEYDKYFRYALKGKSQTFELITKEIEGKQYFFEVSISRLEQNTETYLLAILRDITEKKAIEEKLKILSLTIEQSPAMVMITDIDGNIEYVNPTFTKITGFTFEETIGQKPSILKSNKMSEIIYSELWQTILSGKTWKGELNNKKKNGELYWEHLYISPIKNELGKIIHLVAVKEDITLLKKYEEELLKQANYDNLTGLPNRILAMDRLTQAIEQTDRSDTTSLLMLVDIDRFKNINDSLGHMVGDQLINKVGQRIKTCVKKYDTVARLGGDEYLIIIPEACENKTTIVEKILNAFKEPFKIDNHLLYVTVSIGISVCPLDGKDPYILLRNADSAMYKAKSEGRNKFWFYSSEMNKIATRMLEMEMELRKALERNEIYLNYQPKIDLKTYLITGVETLMRWKNQKLGFVSPDEFIPVAENTGLIIELSNFMMKEACKQYKIWNEITDYSINLAVNVSSQQFKTADFLDNLMDILENENITPELFEIEITESLLIEDIKKTTEILNFLSDKGISISIDDFGTGYSSLSYLKKFPVNKLKIDRSFIINLSENTDDYELVNAIVLISKSLGLEVIAEGVETREQEALLKKINCDKVQGYYYSRPLSDKDFIEYLKNIKN